ncbi:MAG: hypothetical protein ACK5MZ_08580, partial [Aestuariibaculum sp.]
MRGEVQTFGMLPDEEIIFELSNNNNPNEILFTTVATVNSQGITQIQLIRNDAYSTPIFDIKATAKYGDISKSAVIKITSPEFVKGWWSKDK